MKIKKFTVILTAVFLIIMVLLTLFARTFKNNYILPNVLVTHPTIEQFEYCYTLEDGTEISAVRSGLAIKKEIYDKWNDFYIIQTRVKNNENRTYARRINLFIDGKNETSYELPSDMNSISKSDFIIYESNKELSDGDEVIVK